MGGGSVTRHTRRMCVNPDKVGQYRMNQTKPGSQCERSNEMQQVDWWEIRRALWRTKRWDQSLDVDAGAAAVADLITPGLALEVQVRYPDAGFTVIHDEVHARVTARMRERLVASQADLEAQGFALSGGESVHRVLDAAVAALTAACQEVPGTV